MNERIKELYNQSLEEKYQYGGSDAKPGEMYSNYITVLNPEKFAELIVLECVNAVMDGTKEGDHYAMRIEQHFDNGQGGILHFGVEELPVCKHDWYSAKNPVVQNGSVCVICGAIDAREPEELKNERTT